MQIISIKQIGHTVQKIKMAFKGAKYYHPLECHIGLFDVATAWLQKTQLRVFNLKFYVLKQ